MSEDGQEAVRREIGPHFPLQGGRTGATLLGTLFREGGGMKKIFGRAGFFPLPLREKAGMREILFSAVLIAAWTVVAAGPAAAQNQYLQEKRNDTKID